tara:strand:+ start:286 stop:522 length:237 start_codon:yes stop_codon:yes gene_type:complete
MRYNQDIIEKTSQDLQIYSQSDGLHFMLNLTVSIALVVGFILFFLSIKGRIIWLGVWSIGLIIFSVAYLFAAIFDLLI